MKNYNVGDNKPYEGEPFATITEALDALHGDLIGKGKPCIQVHEQADADEEEKDMEEPK